MTPPTMPVDGALPAPTGYVDHLRELIAAGRNGDAVEYFQLEAVGLPKEMVEQMKPTPAWGYLSAMAPTLLYDALCLGGNDRHLPVELLARITVPALTIGSTGSPDWLRAAAAETARAIPGATHVSLEGGFHQVPPEVLAPALSAFFSSPR